MVLTLIILEHDKKTLAAKKKQHQPTALFPERPLLSSHASFRPFFTHNIKLTPFHLLVLSIQFPEGFLFINVIHFQVVLHFKYFSLGIELGVLSTDKIPHVPASLIIKKRS